MIISQRNRGSFIQDVKRYKIKREKTRSLASHSGFSPSVIYYLDKPVRVFLYIFYRPYILWFLIGVNCVPVGRFIHSNYEGYITPVLLSLASHRSHVNDE